MDINALVALANDKLMCGPDCQKDRQTEKLRQIYNNAKQTLIDAPRTFTLAEKNYLIDSKGENEYKNIMKERTIKTMNEMKKKLLDKHTQFVQDIRGYLNQYSADYIYYNRMDDFYKSSLKENKKYKQDIADYTSNMNVNNRKVFYENEEIDNLSFFRIVLLVIYFAVLIAILYKMDFIGNQLYTNKYALFAIFMYIMFGLYVDWVSKMVYYLRQKITHIFENDAPRNVYISM
jgi:hypothetical protein